MENSKFKTEYKLKQHTMLLHFQAKPSSGENVCLRASEVKPKLDRFILKKLGEIKTVKEKYSSWIQAEHLNGNDVAFKYRMTIKADKTEVKHPNDIPKIYYGNMGKSNQDKLHAVIFPSGVALTITCFIPKLSDYIKKHIVEFFAVTNFGTMQNKGFGSFTIEGIDEETVIIDEETVIEALKNNYDSKKCFRIAVNQSGYDNETQKTLFNTVKQVYSVMKSGQNKVITNPDRTITTDERKYIRSFIYDYMHEKYIGNEKAYLKLNKVVPIRTTHGDYNGYIVRKRGHEDLSDGHECVRQNSFLKHRYIRLLLGFGASMSWLQPVAECYNEHNDKFYSPNREVISVEDITNTEEDKNIARCPSPIFFKIIGSNIYFTANNPNEKTFERKFKFTNTGYEQNGERRGRRKDNSDSIDTLKSDEAKLFDMADFLTKYKGYYNNNINKFRRNLRFPIEEV